MAKTNFKSVDDYIAAQPEGAKGILGQVRSTIRKALPRAEEVISYQIPAYKLHRGAVLYFAVGNSTTRSIPFPSVSLRPSKPSSPYTRSTKAPSACRFLSLFP